MLTSKLDDMRGLGIDIARISPQSQRTPAVITAIADVLRGARGSDDAEWEPMRHMPSGPCDGDWSGNAGMTWHR